MHNHDGRVKTALLIRNANSFDFGGAERFVVALAKEVSKYGWQAIVVSSHEGIAKHARDENVAFMPGPWWSLQDWSGKRMLLFPLYIGWQVYLVAWYLRVIRKTHADVVHPQGRDDFIGATIAGRLLRKTVVWTDHADLKYIYQNVPTPFKNPGGKWIWHLSRKVRAVTLVSKSEQHSIQKALHVDTLPGQYQVIYNGILDETVTPAKRTKDEQGTVIFCVTSRLVVAKGIGELIAAFDQLSQRHNVRLWIVGDGPDSDMFRAQAAHNPAIVFKGFQADVRPLLAASDVFVHPSYHEGFSISIVEAAMLGKPMIACNVGGNPEIVHNNVNGLLVKEKDPQSLADAMETLATNTKLRQQFGIAARATYKSQFEFDHIVQERFLPLYE